MRLRAVFTISFLAFTGLTPAFACSCARSRGGPCTGINQQAILFLGTVISADNPPTDTREDQMGTAHYRIRVDEVFSNMEAKEVDVYSGRGGGDCSVRFKVGEQYLVNPHQSSSGELAASICSDTRIASGASAYIRQLRKRKQGGVSSQVFGMLWQRSQGYGFSWSQEEPKRLGGIPVRLKDSMNTYETATESDGSFEFNAVRPGSYLVSASLPSGLEIAEPVLDRDVTIEVAPNSCEEQTFYALPSTSVTGRVIDKAGNLLPYAAVALYSPDHFDEKDPGRSATSTESQSEDRKTKTIEPFKFRHVPAGDYILVANYFGRVDRAEPFERTFYPSTTERQQAKLVHVGQGQSVEGLEIVVERKPTKDLIVHVSGVDFEKEKYIFLESTNGPAVSTYTEVSPGLFRVTVLRPEEFDLFAHYSCPLPIESNRYRAGLIKTNQIHVTGDERTPTEISLTFSGNATCQPREMPDRSKPQ